MSDTATYSGKCGNYSQIAIDFNVLLFARLNTMNQQETLNEIGRLNLECALIQAQMNLARAEEQLTIKKVKWYECVLFGGAGITIGLALAKIFS